MEKQVYIKKSFDDKNHEHQKPAMLLTVRYRSQSIKDIFILYKTINML